jgi:predicted CoA-substrate-specific enzyme activase
MRYYCGIDIGASSAKLVLIDTDGCVLAHAVRPSGVDYAHTAEVCLSEALAMAGLTRKAVCGAVSTGYGRDNVPWAGQGTMTEIACHGRGAYAYFPRAITVIDIGAQDSKMIHLDAEGRRLGFKMNRKCAAGTGAFLEEIAHRLGLDASELNELAERSTEQVTLGSFCTVFAATEILEKIRAGKRVEDIVRGAFSSVVKRIVEMDCPQGQLVMTGGVVAHNPLMARLMGEAFGQPVHVPSQPQLVGALGAALFAREKVEKGS